MMLTATIFRLVADSRDEIVAAAQWLPGCRPDPASVTRHPAGDEWSIAVAVSDRVEFDAWARAIAARLRGAGHRDAAVAPGG